MSDTLVKKAPAEVTCAELSGNGKTFTPRFDIWENDSELVLYGDLPGVTAESLDVHYENRELTIRGKVEPRHCDIKVLYDEYGVGDFYRSFSLGESIDGAKISAELKNGVLVLHLPKVEAVKARRIDVKTD